jgi:hypothetical protein
LTFFSGADRNTSENDTNDDDDDDRQGTSASAARNGHQQTDTRKKTDDMLKGEEVIAGLLKIVSGETYSLRFVATIFTRSYLINLSVHIKLE